MPGGGGGNGPCRCAAIGSASVAHATIKSALTPIFFRPLSAIPETAPLILCALLILIRSLLYLKIRCIEHEFRSPHLEYNGKFKEVCQRYAAESPSSTNFK